MEVIRVSLDPGSVTHLATGQPGFGSRVGNQTTGFLHTASQTSLDAGHQTRLIEGTDGEDVEGACGGGGM